MTNATFSFSLASHIKFGPGVAQELRDYLHHISARQVGLIVDRGVVDAPAWRDVAAGLTGFDMVTFENTVSEPDYDYLDECRERLMSHTFDCIVGVGGGSTLDLAKALSVLATNPGPAINYRGFDKVKQPGPPVVAVPTTAGTGSEVTPNAVFTDKREMRKLGINSAFYVPKLALLDPTLTVSCPRSVTLSSGMDALVHALESYVARGATPISRTFSREAFARIFNTLPRVVAEPADVGLRGEMQLGAYYAGIALMNSGAGLAGAMSYPLGVRFRVPHGLAGAVFLPRVVRLNVRRGVADYGDLLDLITGAAPRPDGDRAAEFSRRVTDLCRQLDVPATLRKFGVMAADVATLAEETMLLRGAIEQNPVPVSVHDVREILTQMLQAEG
jgi:alcohol dehydrogenase class IV